MATDRKLSSDAGELREPEIKAALIDALYSDGAIYGDTVVVSEMPVSSMSRRADIVVANGHLVGFEIKSDADKTSRLAGQLKAYQTAFEGIVIVTGARHLEECLRTSSPTVGVVAIDQIKDDLPQARMVRKPHLRKMSIEEAMQQMHAGELYKLTRLVDANPTCKRDRFTLEGIVRQLPSLMVRDAAMNAIKARYRPNFEAFSRARSASQSTLSAIKHLQRPIEHRAVPLARPATKETIECSADLTALSLSVRPRRLS